MTSCRTLLQHQQNKQNLEKFAQIVRTMYTTGSADMFGVLAGSADFYDLMISSEVVGKISEQNLQFMNELTADMKKLDSDKKLLETDKKDLEGKKTELDTQMTKLLSEKEELDSLRQEKGSPPQAQAPACTASSVILGQRGGESAGNAVFAAENRNQEGVIYIL